MGQAWDAGVEPVARRMVAEEGFTRHDFNNPINAYYSATQAGGAMSIKYGSDASLSQVSYV
jgi:hypothetical protein